MKLCVFHKWEYFDWKDGEEGIIVPVKEIMLETAGEALLKGANLRKCIKCGKKQTAHRKYYSDACFGDGGIIPCYVWKTLKEMIKK